MSKKIILAVVAIALVFALCTMGTIAYLTAKSNGGDEIKNTFVASEGLIEKPENPDNPGDPTDNGIFIVETDANDPEKLTTSGNEYTVIPNVDVDKDAKLVINGKTDLAGYVFIEVIDTLDSELSYDIASDWVDLSATGNNGGKLYVYKEVVTTDISVSILDGDKIKVSSDYEAEDGGALSFYGYICQQASFEAASDAEYNESALAAYNACFPADPS